MKKCSRCQEMLELDRFTNNRAAKDGKCNYCITCKSIVRKENKDLKGDARRNRRYARSLGYGVYKATYENGIYIGSGQIKRRMNKHQNGEHKYLQGKASKVEILVKCSEEHCGMYEGAIIEEIGLVNLLNVNKTYKKRGSHV